MSCEVHAGFCERRGVRLPPATHPVIHCVSERQARFVRDAVARRLVEVGLELHPDKTRIVYCKDSNRRGNYEEISFTFCGYAFRPRLARSRRRAQAWLRGVRARNPELFVHWRYGSAVS